MDFLINKGSIDTFFKNVLIPLSFYGLGSINDLLSMKIWQIRECMICLKDEETQKLFKATRGMEIEK